MPVISLGYRCGRCGNKRGIYSSLFWLLRKTLGRGGAAAFVGVLLKQSIAVPDEMGAFRVGARLCQFVLAFFGEPSSERVVGVCPDLRAVAS